MKDDASFKSFCIQGGFTAAAIYNATDTASARSIAVNQLTPKIEAVRANWKVYLAGRSDRNTIWTAAVDENMSKNLPASWAGPCDDNYLLMQRQCKRQLLTGIAFCTVFTAATAIGYAACLGGVGVAGYLCGIEAQENYNACLSTPAVIGQTRGTWKWNGTKWVYFGPVVTGGCDFCN